MFKDTNDEEETSFAEAYRSQILNKDEDTEEKSSKNLIIIFILVIIVSALSIFGYRYLSENSQTETIKEKPIKEVVEEEEPIKPPESMMLNNINDLLEEESADIPKETTQKEESTLDETADSVKIEMAKELNETKKAEEVEEKKTSKKKGEDTYLEQLAELSKEIDGEK
ncbi:hypothetical protein MNB_SV-12-192 [hydrothermal vent metagenome]|uniref:Uncharacterized protein n=1 Tax=hydrothermal vent metagenome TaxID=652676 RepID=A0A1W1BU43_9ZZZZ